MFGELLQRRFADAAGPADKDGHETWRKSGGGAEIRGLDVDEGDHCCDVVKGTCRNESTGWCAEDQVEKYNVLPSQLRRDSKGMALGLFDINPAWHDFRTDGGFGTLYLPDAHQLSFTYTSIAFHRADAGTTWLLGLLRVWPQQ